MRTCEDKFKRANSRASSERDLRLDIMSHKLVSKTNFFKQIGGLQKKIEPYKPLQGRWHSHGCLSEFVLHFKQLPIQLNGKQSDIGMLCKD